MTWYFLNEPAKCIIAVTPRVASTSQRKCYEDLKFPPVHEPEAKRFYDAGYKVTAVIRDPLERAISAYRRHKPGWVTAGFEEYVTKRHKWDSHIMPQTEVHVRNGINPTNWTLFEQFFPYLPYHENETPARHKAEHQIHISPKFTKWFNEVYKPDYTLRKQLIDSLFSTKETANVKSK